MKIISTSTGIGLRGCLVALLLMAATRATAQEPLRWKFEPGQKLNYGMVQDMKLGSTGGPLGDQNVTMNQEMQMTWEVISKNEQGDAVIRQKFERMKMKMELPAPAGTMEYDSKSDVPPTGMAAMFAPLYKALSSVDFQLTITPRGEITDVVVPDEVISALKNIPGGGSMGDMATPEGFKKLISNGALVLPEGAPEPGKEWSTKMELNNALVGKQVVETTYRYEDTKVIDDVHYAVFRPNLKMSIEGNQQMKVTEQDSSGEILFNADAGRLHTSTLNQKITMEQAGVKINIDQSIKVNVTPAAPEASGKES